ncbi:MAG: PhzF family phenazine biosynthesis protein [bacterium]
MKYRFYTCDVFTDVRFGGNPLAVIPSAEGLSSQQMQQIAREFNYSESTFVLPGNDEYTRNVRIFTPAQEVPFAGHPNIGTAFTLAKTGELGSLDGGLNIVFKERAGSVPITILKNGSDIWCELKAPEPLSIGQPISVDLIASALSLTPEDIVTDTHLPVVASVGLPFVMVELKNRAALESARPYTPAIEEIHAKGIMPDIHVYIRSKDEFDIRARMFAPLDGVPEDPATGSANCALVAMLSHYNSESEGEFSWRIAQGVEMKRPSVLDARTKKRPGTNIDVWIAGTCKMVSEGFIEI